MTHIIFSLFTMFDIDNGRFLGNFYRKQLHIKLTHTSVRLLYTH